VSERPIRVLIGKPGLDGHDVGAKVVARALLDAGFEVIYTGLRQSPEQIVAAARDEDVDVVSLSILSGAHLPICQRIRELLAAEGLAGRLWVVGGNIPRADHEPLRALGVDAVFPTGTRLAEIVEFIRENAHERAT